MVIIFYVCWVLIKYVVIKYSVYIFLVMINVNYIKNVSLVILNFVIDIGIVFRY